MIVSNVNDKGVDWPGGLEEELGISAPFPCALGAERALLGFVLLDNRCWPGPSALEPDDFSLDSHRRIWYEMAVMFKAKEAVDLMTLSYAFGKEVSKVGGVAYIASLTEGVYRLQAPPQDLIDIIKEKSRLRHLMAVCANAIAKAQDGQRANDILRETMNLLSSIRGTKLANRR